jgi:DNA-binding CsgD family transcriptional regulator
MKKSEIVARATARKYQIQAEYAAGATMQQIADRHGLTRQRVQAMLASIGTQARARGPKGGAKPAGT